MKSRVPWYLDNFDKDLEEHMAGKTYEKPVISEAVKILDSGKRQEFYSGAIREPATNKGRFDLISPFAEARIAEWYELGAKKYADRNWEKGLPFSRYVDSAKRHINRFLQGEDAEDNLAAACWNLMAIMHHQECKQNELDDLPKYRKWRQNKDEL